MTKTINTKLSEDEIRLLDEIAEKEKLDREILVKKFLLQQLEEYKIQEFAELYRKGIDSLQEAASGANVSVYKMMEYLQKEHIRAPKQDKNDFDDELQRSMNYHCLKADGFLFQRSSLKIKSNSTITITMRSYLFSTSVV